MIALTSSQLAALCAMRVGTVELAQRPDRTLVVRCDPDDGRRWLIDGDGRTDRVAERTAA